MRHLAPIVFAALFVAPDGLAQTQVWNQRYPATAAVPRRGHAMAYDEARQTVVVCGGIEEPTPGQASTATDTLEWSRDPATGQWAWQSIPLAPSGRSNPAMVYDTARQRTVLFGGTLSGTLGDTWEWDGTTWSLGPTGPSPRDGMGMAYDRARAETVLFGGAPSTAIDPDGETWVYDGSTWTQKLPATSPPPLADVAMAYDSARQKVVLFGGTKGNPGGLSDETWEWDGNDWTRRFPRNSPPPMSSHKMVYDEVRARMVMYSRYAYPLTWEWDGANWSIHLTAPPSPRDQFGMVYNAACGRVMMFGGHVRNAQTTASVWEYYLRSPAAFAPLGTGCAGTSGVPVLAATNEPWFCEGSFDLSLTAAGSTPVGLLGVSETAWLGLNLPADLGTIGMPGCQLYISIEASVPLVATAGTATWTIDFPPLPELVTASFYTQCLVFDPEANGLGIVTSNAGKATIGAR